MALLAAGCNSERPPWERSTGSSLPYFAPGSASAPVGEVAEPPSPSGSALESGGIFDACYRGFHPSGDAVKDVTRLGLACGPVTGMHRILETPIAGASSEGSAELDFPVELADRGCYRIFAVSESKDLAFEATIVSSHGLPVASATSKDGWLVVEGDRPFCAIGSDSATIRFGARSGSGRFAVDVYARP
jgi:hypothetical protein